VKRLDVCKFEGMDLVAADRRVSLTPKQVIVAQRLTNGTFSMAFWTSSNRSVLGR